MENSIHFTCEGCGKTLKARNEIGGKKTRCACGHVLTIPESLQIRTAGPELSPSQKKWIVIASLACIALGAASLASFALHLDLTWIAVTVLLSLSLAFFSSMIYVMVKSGNTPLGGALVDELGKHFRRAAYFWGIYGASLIAIPVGVAAVDGFSGPKFDLSKVGFALRLSLGLGLCLTAAYAYRFSMRALWSGVYISVVLLLMSFLSVTVFARGVPDRGTALLFCLFPSISLTMGIHPLGLVRERSKKRMGKSDGLPTR